MTKTEILSLTPLRNGQRLEVRLKYKIMKREDIEKAAKIYQEQEKDHDIWAGKDLRRKYERL